MRVNVAGSKSAIVAVRNKSTSTRGKHSKATNLVSGLVQTMSWSSTIFFNLNSETRNTRMFFLVRCTPSFSQLGLRWRMTTFIVCAKPANLASSPIGTGTNPLSLVFRIRIEPICFGFFLSLIVVAKSEWFAMVVACSFVLSRLAGTRIGFCREKYGSTAVRWPG